MLVLYHKGEDGKKANAVQTTPDTFLQRNKSLILIVADGLQSTKFYCFFIPLYIYNSKSF